MEAKGEQGLSGLPDMVDALGSALPSLLADEVFSIDSLNELSAIFVFGSLN